MNQVANMQTPPDANPKSGKGWVRIAGLSVVFGEGETRTIALTPTDLDLEPGTFTALIGPSGCGKSTLLNAVAGFTAPTEGSVQVDGRKVTGPHPSVGVIFQNFALFPWFTARGNVEFALKRFGLDKAERRKRAMEALGEVGLSEHATKFPGQLSGGMKQRVAIARTLAADPNVLLMDEPFGALDAQTRLRMHELLTGIWMRRMASAPGRIIEHVPVDLERPRPVDRMSDGFLTLRSKLLGLLRHED